MAVRKIVFVAGALALATMLPACGPVGAVADIAVRDGQVDRGKAAQDKIHGAWRTDPTLKKVKASVAVANTMESAWQTRWSVVLTGDVPTAEDKRRAVEAVPGLIGVDADAVKVLDYLKATQ